MWTLNINVKLIHSSLYLESKIEYLKLQQYAVLINNKIYIFFLNRKQNLIHIYNYILNIHLTLMTDVNNNVCVCPSS